MAKKNQISVSFKDGTIYVDNVAKVNLTLDSSVAFEVFEKNVVAAVKNIGPFVCPRYFVIQENGEVHQRRTPEAVGEMLNSTKAFVNRIKKLI